MKYYAFALLVLASTTAAAQSVMATVSSVTAQYQGVMVATPDCKYVLKSHAPRATNSPFVNRISGATNHRDNAPEVITVCKTKYKMTHALTGYLVIVSLGNMQYPMVLNYNPGIGRHIPLELSPL